MADGRPDGCTSAATGEARPPLRNTVRGDRLWDERGREWARRRPQWLSPQEAARYVRRGEPVAIYEVEDGAEVQWLRGGAATTWWRNAEAHVQVPGGGAGVVPDARGRTWGCHLWRHEGLRRVGFLLMC